MIRPRRTLLPIREMRDRPRDKILDSAAALFAREGFAGTSIEQVIAGCGVGRDTFYRRFHSKLALFEAVALRERERTNARFAAFTAAPHGTSLEQLEVAARWLLEVNLDPGLIDMKRIAFSEARVFGRNVQDAASPITDHLIALVQALQDEDIFASGDPANIVEFIINTLILGPMVQSMLAEKPIDDVGWRDTHFEQVWPKIVRGLSV